MRDKEPEIRSQPHGLTSAPDETEETAPAQEEARLCTSCVDVTAALDMYADLYELAPVGYLTLDGAGVIRAVNRTGEKLLGMQRDQMIGMQFGNLVTDHSRHVFAEMIQRLSRNGGKGAGEVEIVRKDHRPLFVRIEAVSRNSGLENRLALFDITERIMSDEALLASEARYRRLFETAKDGIMIVDAVTGRITEVNPYLEQMLGYGGDELRGRKLWEVETFAGISANRREFEALQHRDLRREDLSIVTRDGRSLAVEVVGSSYDADGKVIQYNLRDITARKEAEEALQKSEEQCRTIVSNINEYVYSVRFEGGNIKSIYHSPKCLEITGYSPEEYYSDPLLWFTMIHEDDRDLVVEFLNAIFAGEDRQPIRHRIIHKNGSERWILNNCAVQRVDNNGKGRTISRLDGFILDITEIKQAEENIFFLAHHDPLTKLPNRSTLYARIEQVLSVAQKSRRKVALLFLDIDGFKQINDTMGHDVGDQLLQSVARRLNDCTRSCDVVSRLGGDEFVVVLWDCGMSETTVVAEKIITSGFPIEGSSVVVNTSIGISLYPDDGTDYLALLKHADTAMYHAKKEGGKSFQFFTPTLNEMAHQRFAIEIDLRRALEENEFVLHYQPKVDLVTGRFSGMEALIRWQHPERGMIHPEVFIHIAEDSGLLTPISKWIVETVCRQIQQWQQQGIQISVAVNISPSFFQHRDFEDTIERCLSQTGIPPESLELELTEATVMSDPQMVLASMAAMKALGLQLSIDDFGTGYSSLSYLKKLPVDKLKIDQSFIHNIATDPDNAAVVRAVISIGRSMQLKVIAEGVENISQLTWLQTEGSQEAQGYYFSRPLSTTAVTSLLKQHPNFLHNPRGRHQAHQAHQAHPG